jgi:uncharacterized RDD family membrane protein YckC
MTDSGGAPHRPLPPPGAAQFPPPPPNWHQRHLELAGFWRRGVGLIIDTMLFVVVSLSVHGALELAGFDVIRWGRIRTASGRPSSIEIPIPNRVTAIVISISVTVAYAIMIQRRGATPGMKAMGLRAQDVATGANLSMRSALLREVPRLLLRQVGSFIPYVSLSVVFMYAWMIWDDKRQTLHDKVGGCIVVRTRTRSAPDYRFTEPQAPGEL